MPSIGSTRTLCHWICFRNAFLPPPKKQEPKSLAVSAAAVPIKLLQHHEWEQFPGCSSSRLDHWKEIFLSAQHIRKVLSSLSIIALKDFSVPRTPRTSGMITSSTSHWPHATVMVVPFLGRFFTSSFIVSQQFLGILSKCFSGSHEKWRSESTNTTTNCANDILWWRTGGSGGTIGPNHATIRKQSGKSRHWSFPFPPLTADWASSGIDVPWTHPGPASGKTRGGFMGTVSLTVRTEHFRRKMKRNQAFGSFASAQLAEPKSVMNCSRRHDGVLALGNSLSGPNLTSGFFRDPWSRSECETVFSSLIDAWYSTDPIRLTSVHQSTNTCEWVNQLTVGGMKQFKKRGIKQCRFQIQQVVAQCNTGQTFSLVHGTLGASANHFRNTFSWRHDPVTIFLIFFVINGKAFTLGCADFGSPNKNIQFHSKLWSMWLNTATWGKKRGKPPQKKKFKIHSGNKSKMLKYSNILPPPFHPFLPECTSVNF